MKAITIVMGAALLIISGVMFSLVRRGGALKPAGVIKPAPVEHDLKHIGQQIAVRLFPDFDVTHRVIWRLESGVEEFAEIPRSALKHNQLPHKPTLHDLRVNSHEECSGNCWYILDFEAPLPEQLAQELESEPNLEIFIQYFHRDEKVPEACDAEKILTVQCMRPVSVREVRRKFKTSAPHYFMQRYQRSQFYLYIER